MKNYVRVDAFTGTPLEGNPVAVFTDARELPAVRMQQIAREMNLSETTFVFPPERGGDARVRVFTPVNELPFAGHPALGTAAALGDERDLDHVTMEFTAGIVDVKLERRRRFTVGRMTQPTPSWQPYPESGVLLEALGVTGSFLPVDVYCNGPRHVYVEVENVAALSRIRPDLRTMAALPDMAAICFARSDDSRFHARMFSPAYGVDEDPATGSAAGPLAVHLARHGRLSYGKEIEIHQGMDIDRPSTMLAVAYGDGEQVDGVEVAGKSVVAGRGELFV